jgi:DNA-binding transcriptional ArsR family regulator
MNNEDAKARAGILKAVAHPARVMIIDELSRGERCGCELQPRLGLDQSVVSRHLAQLKNAGVIEERRAGVKVMYRLACPCILKALDCTVDVLKSDARRRTGLATAARSGR